MWYGINNLGVKKFEDFLLHDFPHRIIQPSLRFSRWCARGIDWNAMGAKCWTCPLKILKGIPKNRPMFLKNSDEFDCLLISKLVTDDYRSFGVTIKKSIT
jgi:hypothetical protein